jgi:hypothetical protein
MNNISEVSSDAIFKLGSFNYDQFILNITNLTMSNVMSSLNIF